ncbi:hypothetical protein OO256_28870 [Pseudomonas sp. DCB_CB]|uniref:hypothetical protein n=1 Tax=unclassified Pseudomonas TaxID=196821 RepID=UPI002249A14E|nr:MULTISPECIES: hypothetical protein [unclassified Pseudomonas]MCX2695007.1 hypothetical protein [Pseudomonas sp. DCB_BZ]MCX2860093.1 hypothetical protein [Pseudomonas sp. DCB_CB]
MPTENRSSNTEMVSEPFQREERYVVIKVSKMHPHPTFRAKHLSALKREHEDALVDCVVVERDWPEYEPTWAAIEARVTGQPAPQPHPEPIAWMVGTAFWWTKEEAERDAAATGLPIVGLGPMTDSGEVEQLREVIKHSDDQIMRQSLRISNQRAQLAERDALLRLVRDGNGYLEEQDWERINAITEHGSGEATQSQNVSYERLLREVARELREPSHVGWEDSLASRIDAALYASAELETKS